MQVGDRVYDKEINANGYILEAGSQMSQVQYFWGMHSKYSMGWAERSRDEWHTETPDKRRWVNNSDLILTPKPETARNEVVMFGRRVLNKRIALICEFSRTIRPSDADILIRYGKRPPYSYTGDALVLNHNLTINKSQQTAALRGLVPETHPYPTDDMNGNDWIVKPHYSVGGKGIEPWNGTNHHGKYLQKRINKAREFRAQCFLWSKDNKVPLIQEKMIMDKSQLCWNMKKGGKFHYVHEPTIGKRNLDDDLVQRITDISVKALKQLKYDMGGVDLALSEDGELFILEVNSYWGQREMTLAATKSVFWELLNLDIEDYKARRWQPEIPVQDAVNLANLEIELEQTEPLGILSQLEEIVTPEEREVMLEAGRKVTFPAMLADSEVQYA